MVGRAATLTAPSAAFSTRCPTPQLLMAKISDFGFSRKLPGGEAHVSGVSKPREVGWGLSEHTRRTSPQHQQGLGSECSSRPNTVPYPPAVISCRTAVQVRCGTPPYVSPEVLAHGKITRASDVWCYGLILHVRAQSGADLEGS